MLKSLICLSYGVEGCPLFRGCCLSIEVNVRTVGTLELSVISWVSAVKGVCVLEAFH